MKYKLKEVKATRKTPLCPYCKIPLWFEKEVYSEKQEKEMRKLRKKRLECKHDYGKYDTVGKIPTGTKCKKCGHEWMIIREPHEPSEWIYICRILERRGD